ncbi:PH domain-containing protein [Patescibacteria group bacterium]|nr:PH domain-containing protein [Patescibacteria group bacterium]MBU1951786.1 PH domain-containing protein [Patescibacteria group bacterium]
MSKQYFTKHLKEGEETVKIVRAYILSQIFKITVIIILILLPFFLLFLLFQRGFWGVIGFFALLIIAIAFTTRSAIIWYYNAFMITNKRIIDFDQKGLFDKTVSVATYDKIQDISFKKKGVFSTVFNYGTIVIQTAGTNANLEIRSVFEPEKIQDVIMEIQRDSLQDEKVSKEEMSASELIDILEQTKEKLGKERFDRFLKSQDINSSLQENQNESEGEKEK